MLGSVVDSRYELLRLLGSGGMGAVYEALHRGTGRRVAVKLIARPDLSDDDEVLVRFQREAQVAARVDTPHIVNIIDAGRDRASGLPFIAMELLDGYDVKELVAHMGALSPELALRIGAQACSGLSKAHAAGIVHRDIKPANLFLARRPDGSVIVKLLDFGIAKLPADLLASIEGGRVTVTGKLLGSPLFMSPEQAQGLKTLDHRTDIWSLGAVLYEALAGHAPFSGFNTVGQIIVAICSHPPPDLEQVANWVPPAAAAFVRRAMSIDVGRRYPTAGAMLEDLLELLPGGTAMDESVLTGMSIPQVAPRIAKVEPTRSTLVTGSPSSKPEPDPAPPATELSPPPPDWDRGSLVGLKVSQPARPVTVSLVPDPKIGPTLRSSEHPPPSAPVVDVTVASAGGARSRTRWFWGPSVGAVAVIILLGVWARRLLPDENGKSSVSPVAPAAAPSMGEPAQPAPPPPSPPARNEVASPDAPAAPAVANATIPAGAMASPPPPRPSPILKPPVPASKAAPSSSVLAPLAAASVSAAPAPGAVSGADAGSKRARFNTLNPNFE